MKKQASKPITADYEEVKPSKESEAPTVEPIIKDNQKSCGDNNDSIESKPVKRKAGNPAFVKGMRSPNPKGRPKGKKNKTTEFKEALQKGGIDYFKELGRLLQSETVPDATKLNKLVELAPYIAPRLKHSESESNHQQTLTIQFTEPETKDNIIEGELIVDGKLIE